MTEQAKPRYKLRWRNEKKTYIGLYEGDHCLAAICIKKPRGLLDARLLLTAMDSHKDLLRCVKQYASVLKEGHAECGNVDCVVCLEYKRAEAAIENAKSK